MAERLLRIAYVNHTARLGGGEYSLLKLLAGLDPARVRPTVVLGEEGPLADRLRAAGVDPVVLPLDPRVGERRKESLGTGALASPRAALSLARASARLAAELRRRRIDIVHTNSLKAHVWGGLAARLAGAKLVWHVRDHISAPYLPRPAALAVRLLARVLPHRVVTVSDSARRALGVPAAVARHGVALRPEHDGADRDGRPRVGLVGRIAPWKGQHVFVAAAEQVLRELPETEFLVVGAPLFGEEAYEQAVRRQVESLGLAERVRFLGFRADVDAIYRQLDVAVHASTQAEPFGNVIVEAMASGTPVVAAAAGGPLEIIEHERSGLLVPPGDADALARALVRLLRDPEERRRLARGGRERLERHFAPGQEAVVVQRVYEDLVA